MNNLDYQKYVPYIVVGVGLVLAVKYSFWVLLGVAGYVGYNVYVKYFKKG